MPPLIRAVDAVVVRVPDLDEGLRFYRDGLVHEVIRRTETMVALRLGASGTELVLALELGPETDLLVAAVDDAVGQVVAAGGSVVSAPEDIPVGRVAVVRDPFGTPLTLVDLSKGRYPGTEDPRARALDQLGDLAASVDAPLMLSGGEVYVGTAGAAAAVDRFRSRDAVILGFEGFDVDGVHLRPRLDRIADLSALEGEWTARVRRAADAALAILDGWGEDPEFVTFALDGRDEQEDPSP